MNFFKRAITSITRKTGKSAILLALVFVLGNVIAGSFSIGQSVKNTENAAMSGISPIATIMVDEEKILEHTGLERDYSNEDFWKEYQRAMMPYYLDANKIEQLGALPSVNYFDYIAATYLTSRTLKKYYPPEAEKMGWMQSDGQQEHFNLTGFQHKEILDVKVGLINIVDERAPSYSAVADGEYTAVISKNFADVNSLRIGDTMTMEIEIIVWPEMDDGFARGGAMWQEPEPEKVIPFEFTIVGIYEPAGKPAQIKNDDWSAMYEEMERHARIYISNKIANEINKIQSEEWKKVHPESYPDDMDEFRDMEHYTPIFAFSDVEDLEEFKLDVVAVLGDFYTITDNQSDFSKIIAPLKGLSTIANIILFVGIGASLIILSLLVTLFLKDRRNEIGIYLAIGERKGRVIGQILAEVLIVSIIGITLSLFSGNLISSALSNSMLENAVIAQQEQESDNMYMGGQWNYLSHLGYGGSDLTLDELVEQYKVSLSPNIIVIFYAGGLITVLLSTLIPILYVLRLNPRKILM